MLGSHIERTGVIKELNEYIKAQMRTGSWETMKWLNQRASRVNFLEVPRDLPEPDHAIEVRAVTWRSKLQERMDALTQANPSKIYSVSLDDQGPNPTGQEALYEQSGDEKKRIMWSGTTVTLAQKGIDQQGDRTIVPVYPISYSEWIACYNPDYAKTFREVGLPLPYAGIGVSVLMVTSDGAEKDDRTNGLIPLTRRGLETPVYPGRLYSPGGGPKPGQTSTAAILEEVLEETGLERGRYFDPDEMFMLALVSDSSFAGSEHSRPELVAYLPVNATFNDIERIQHEASIKKGLSQEDVWGVVPFSAFTPNLARAITFNGPEMCPPTEAGLAHLMLYQEMRREGLAKALENVESMMRRLSSFRRTEFKPLIERLARV